MFTPFQVYPPNTSAYLPVSKKHKIFYATYGNPKGIPVVVLHGGPGAGCADGLTSFFDLNTWHVIMLDQRGAMRSAPFAEMEENTTQNLVEDIEMLKNHLKIDQWVCFGGSWGSLLALLYGQAYPKSCLGFVLRGIFLGREKDYKHLLYDMGKLFPQAYQEFLNYFPEDERSDLINALYTRIMDPDPTIHMGAAKASLGFTYNGSTPNPSPEAKAYYLGSDQHVLSMGRAFIHYSKHRFFLKDNQTLDGMSAIKHLPAILVHGEKDYICPKEQAVLLHENWENSQLNLLPEGGHAPVDPHIIKGLQDANHSLAKALG
ncbi:MAG: Proline iminopeptidase [Chlamydiia bacterium]|nr:Proline iminopeptidase [Chlamydiia bacterium]MCH9615277.1 Proline iminopeptidase [Chlamydiia bacterium]MCH9628401.1 Proline iminopeptidase [Chlamydiia bacterium]